MEPTPVSHAVTPAPFIKRLSNELLDMICSLLSKRDLLNSRLAWRELGEMADRHIFRCLVFHLRPADGHWFLHFANRPSVSEHVRSLEFVAFCLPQDMPSFAQYSDLMTVSALYQLFFLSSRNHTISLEGFPSHLALSLSNFAPLFLSPSKSVHFMTTGYIDPELSRARARDSSPMR